MYGGQLTVEKSVLLKLTVTVSRRCEYAEPITFSKESVLKAGGVKARNTDISVPSRGQEGA